MPTNPKRANKAKGKDILYLNVPPKNKTFLAKVADRQVGHTSQSAVMEKILTGLEANPKLLNEFGLK